tara:strand:- start:191 stop:526 length:336 start_codon:yes stop_codon:yes gene_type:complete
MDQIPWWLSFILFFVVSFGLICISLVFPPCRAWWLNKWEMKKQEIAEGKAMSSKEKRKIFFHRLKRYLFWPIDFYYSMKESKQLVKRVGWPLVILLTILGVIITTYFGIEL